MLLRRYVKWITVFFTTLLVSEQVPLTKTIDAAPSEASQLLSTVSEFAGEVKDTIVELITRQSDFFQHENEHNQTQPPLPSLSPPPMDPLPESPPEPLQVPETPPPANSTESRVWRMEGSKLVLELDLGWIPRFEVLRDVVGLVALWFGVLLASTSGVDSAGQSRWMYVLIPTAIGFFGGLGYGSGGFCRWCLSRRKPPKVVEKVEPVVVVKEAERRTPANAYFESRPSPLYMIPLSYQNVPDPRRVRAPASVVATRSGHAEETNSTISRIIKKEGDSDSLVAPPPFPNSFWYSPGSPISPTPLNNNEFNLPPYDGFQPKPTAAPPYGLPDTLMGPSPPGASSPPEPNLSKIPDPWSNYTPDDLS